MALVTTEIGSDVILRYALFVLVVFFVVSALAVLAYSTKFHPLRKVPGPWISSSSTLWIRWQRWNGRLSLEADGLLKKYGPLVKISPNMVLLNDQDAVQNIFKRKDLETSPPSIRALRIGGHDWTVTTPQHSVARQRRHPVMIATTTSNLKLRHRNFVKNIDAMVEALGQSSGSKSEDIVHHLRVCTLRSAELIMGGSSIDLDPTGFPHLVGEYNFLVVWRLCLPDWAYSWLKFGPFSRARFRVKSSDRLFDLGAEIYNQAKKAQDSGNVDEATNVYQLFTAEDAKYPTQAWSQKELSAEMAGQVLAATETTSSALAFIFYELAKHQDIAQRLHEELMNRKPDAELDSLKFLDACIKEGLRFRPPVALTGSRTVPEGGLEVLGYYLPQGTVVTTQSLSMGLQRPDLFPDADVFNPERWLTDSGSEERRRLLVPFGVGARRCPGSNMALYLMRLILDASFRTFKITVAPETTPEKMEPFEANGYRSAYDRCDLIFTPVTD